MQINFQITECNLCHTNQTTKTIGQHLRYTHTMTAKTYFDKFYKTPENSTCKICGKETRFKCISFGYDKTCCSECTKKLAGILSKTTWANKTPEQIERENNIRKNTCMERFGTESALQRLTHDEHVRIGKLGRQIQKERENENPDFIPVLARTDVRQKCKQTMLQKYGVDSNLKLPDFCEKSVKTKREKNNGKYFSDQSIEKRKATNLQKFGAEHYAQAENAKIGRGLYIYNNIHFDSSWELAYYIWLTYNNIPFTFHPKIRLEYMVDEKTHYYKPDFIVENQLVEIKGDHLLQKIPQKYQCMLDNNVKILLLSDIKPILKWYSQTFETPLSAYKYKKKE